MDQDEINNIADARRFLLGEMPDDEKTVFEQRFIADELWFELTRVTEDELIEAYVRGTLSEKERAGFETYFLSTPRRRERVAFTRAMLQKFSEARSVPAVRTTEAAQNTSLWDVIAGFFRTPALAIGTAFVFLLLIFGGWLFLRDRGPADIAKQVMPPPVATPADNGANTPLPIETGKATPVVTPKDNRNSAPINGDSENKNARPQKQISGPAPVLALFAGSVRGGGEMAELNLPATANGARLQLNLESRDHTVYRVQIVDPDGRLISQFSNLKASGNAVGVFVPASKLKPGDYIVKLSGANGRKQNESVADYPFRVTARQ